MAPPSRFPFVAALVAASLWSPLARAQDEGPEPPKRYFYYGYDYGSQALFNPAYVFLNRGFDVLQLHPTARNPFAWDYGTNLKNVFRNVANPFGPVTREGWGRWLREEIFPLSWTPDTARWAPNYGLHLVGGGMTYRELREWFEDHDVSTPVATLSSIATLYAAAFVNESLENNGTIGDNTDCLADLYVFDSLGVLIFSFDGVADFFSKYLIVSDWSLQPSFKLATGELHNVGNYYAVQLPIPFYRRLKLLFYEGFSTLGGASYEVGSGYEISAAAGGRVDTFVNSTVGSVFNVVSMKPSAALFLDRNRSLLASVQVSETTYYRVSANLYPNALFMTDPGVGLWTAVNADGSFLVGASITSVLGLGVGGGTF